MTKRLAAMGLSMALMAAALPATSALAGQGPAHSAPLMTEQERQHFLDRLKHAKTAEERHRIEAAHRAFIRQRLLERGAELPDDNDEAGSKGQRMHSDATHGSGKRN